MHPILVENNGWGIFIGTPRGKNFFHDQYQLALKHPRWFTSLKTITDTGLVTVEQVEDEIAAGMPRERALQEFYCSFDAQNVGAIFDKWVLQLDAAG
jgi:phage terminase large subunit